MHLIYFPNENTFVLYDSYKFVGLKQEKKFWHFTRKMPKNLLEIVNEIGFNVAEPTGELPVFEEKRRLLKKVAFIHVYDPARQANITGTGNTWVDALNDLVTRLRGSCTQAS